MLDILKSRIQKRESDKGLGELIDSFLEKRNGSPISDEPCHAKYLEKYSEDKELIRNLQGIIEQKIAKIPNFKLNFPFAPDNHKGKESLTLACYFHKTHEWYFMPDKINQAVRKNIIWNLNCTAPEVEISGAENLDINNLDGANLEVKLKGFTSRFGNAVSIELNDKTFTIKPTQRTEENFWNYPKYKVEISLN